MVKYHFFAFISRMKYINRWGLMKNIQLENIQEHSHMAAVIAHALAVIKNKYFEGNINPDRVAVCALYHDANEIITSDIATPIKYFNPEIATAFKNLEKVAKHKLLKMLPNELSGVYKEIMFYEEIENSDVKKLIKAADRICAYIKCIEEEKNGNKEFKKAKTSIYKTIVEMDLPEVKFFLEHFLPSFSLTLDELD